MFAYHMWPSMLPTSVLNMKALSQSDLMLLQLVCSTLRGNGHENCDFVFIFNGGRVSKIFTVFLWLVILVLCDIF